MNISVQKTNFQFNFQQSLGRSIDNQPNIKTVNVAESDY